MAGIALIIKILTCGAFLLFAGADTVKSDKVPIHEKGFCVWYGQCTTGPKAKNCLYNGPAKELDDPKGLKLLNSLCPELKGQHTCCSTKQLDALSKNLETMAQLTTRCPACWNNMRRLYCQLTCNRDQSLYMDPNTVDNSTGHATIMDINYYVSPTFKQGLFDSCKDVNFPGSKEKVLNLLCGTTVKKCTAEKLLMYMGNTANGFAPFNIFYPESLPDKLSWMDITVFKCNKPFIDPQTQKPAPICSCQDCYVPPCLSTTPTPKPTYGPEFRTEQLIIRSTHPSPAGYVRYGDGKWIPFGPIFHLELLNQALDLQNHITNMKVPFEGSSITLQDICFQPLAPQNKKCAIPSIFQYFQNNITRLNKCLTSMGFNCSDPRAKYDFRMADFHDHLLFCPSDPVSFDEKLQLPCLSAYGKPVDPNMALAGFTGDAYNNATTLIITFVVNNYQEESKMAEVMAWERSFVEYMKVYINDSSHANLTIHFSTPKYVQHKLRV